MLTKIVYPTFKDAQLLYSKYSTVENNSVLYNNLSSTIDPTFLSTLDCQNVREIYNKIILKYYPNEICIKSNFINEILMSGKKHVTIFELPIGSSRADLCKINGTSVAYEIKTDLDNFSRLSKQISDYYEIFDEVYVICSEHNIANVINIIPPRCGIYSYSINRIGNYKFNLFRKATFNNVKDPIKQLAIIRKNELSQHFMASKNLKTRTEITNFILNKFSQESINDIFKNTLKQRFEPQWSFLKQNHNDILEIDYQWFYKNKITPQTIYK